MRRRLPPAPAPDTVPIKKSRMKTIGAGIDCLMILGFVPSALKTRRRENT